MIWWVNFVCSTIVLGVSLWAVLHEGLRTRIFGTVIFSCLGLLAALHMRKPVLPGFFSDASALALSLGAMVIAVWLLAYYQAKQLQEEGL